MAESNIEATGASITVLSAEGMRGLESASRRCVGTIKAIITSEYRNADERTREQAYTSSVTRFVTQSAMQNAAERAHATGDTAKAVDIMLSATAGAMSGLVQGLNMHNFSPEMRAYLIDMLRTSFQGTLDAVLLQIETRGDADG